jgi:hypothetical protein
MSPKPCWRRIAFPDSGKVVPVLAGARASGRVRAGRRVASLGTVTVKTRAEPVQIWRLDSLP